MDRLERCTKLRYIEKCFEGMSHILCINVLSPLSHQSWLEYCINLFSMQTSVELSEKYRVKRSAPLRKNGCQKN